MTAKVAMELNNSHHSKMECKISNMKVNSNLTQGMERAHSHYKTSLYMKAISSTAKEKDLANTLIPKKAKTTRAIGKRTRCMDLVR